LINENIAFKKAFSSNAASGKEKVVSRFMHNVVHLSLFHPPDAKVEVGLIVVPTGNKLC